MLIVETPDTRAPERDYILSVILGEFLGLKWIRKPTERRDVRITCSEASSGELLLPDVLLQTPKTKWLKVESLPAAPLITWNTYQFDASVKLVDSTVPIIYGNVRLAEYRSPERLYLPIDIFGSAFFMLTRYEEVVIQDRDKHERFPATASLACRAGFLDRPIIDEYTEILANGILKLWPGLKRKKQEARTLVTCDVDNPFTFDDRLKRMPRRLVGDLFKRRMPSAALRNIQGAWQAFNGIYSSDPNWVAINWIMDVNERAGNKVAFYFIPIDTDSRFDNRYNINAPRVRSLLRDIYSRGHELGIHPGYNTYKYPEAMACSARTLKRVFSEARIDQSKIGSRQHYLRWETPTTARLLDDNELDYDTTLGYADRPGFRCGTCREYSLFDLGNREQLALRERPLIIMDCTVMSDIYMGLGDSDKAISVMRKFKTLCALFQGDFTLLWHNSFELHQASYREIYRKLIE